MVVGGVNMSESKTDLRVLKTKKNIYEALLHLMEQHAFEEIKVSEICENAMINRSTFYAHFEDKYALFDSFINDLRESLKRELEKNHNITSSKEYYMEVIKLLLDHVEEQRDIYTTIMVHNRNSVAMDMIYDTVKSDISSRIRGETKNAIPSDFVSNFYLGAITNVGIEGMRPGSPYSKEDILNYLDLLIPEDLIVK